MSGTFPTTNFKSINWQSNNNIISSETLTNKVFTKDLGGHFWSFTLQSVPLSRDDFGSINAFITTQRGSFDTFTVVPPVIGSSNGTFVNDGTKLPVTTSAAIGDSTIAVTPTGSGTLKAGDIIKFSNHDKVYMLTADVTLANSVANTIDIFPNLLTALPSSGENVITDNVPVKVRLANETQEFKLGIDNLYQYELDVAEKV
jgi:pSer/pThr/pTyr-binding forkhead associated (FHA) protein